jgi:hypothetical protein
MILWVVTIVLALVVIWLGYSVIEMTIWSLGYFLGRSRNRKSVRHSAFVMPSNEDSKRASWFRRKFCEKHIQTLTRQKTR